MMKSYALLYDVGRANRRMPQRVPVSVTLDPELVSWLDGEVAAKKFRSRSDAVESLLELARKGERP